MPRPPGSLVFETLDRRRTEFDHLYLSLGLALRPVADQLGVSVKMMRMWMTERGISRRNQSQAQRRRSKRIGKADKVIRLRLVEHLTMEEIARRLGYSSKGTVHTILANRGLDGPTASLPTYENYLRTKKHGG